MNDNPFRTCGNVKQWPHRAKRKVFGEKKIEKREKGIILIIFSLVLLNQNTIFTLKSRSQRSFISIPFAFAHVLPHFSILVFYLQHDIPYGTLREMCILALNHLIQIFIHVLKYEI